MATDVIRDLDELSPLERLGLIDMSYSRLDTLQMCEAKYFYTYITKQPRQFGAAATLGNVVHSVLEEADFEDIKGGPLMNAFVEQVEAWDPEGQIPQDLLDVGVKVLVEFVDRHQGDQFDILHREMEFEGVIGSGLFRGYIDRVDRDSDGGVTVVDYKTGKYQVTQKWVHQNLQLGLYALFMRHIYPDMWPVRGYLYYLRTGKMIGHTYTQEDLDWVAEEVQKKVTDLISMNNFRYTQNTRVCGFCDFKEICPGGKRYR